MIITLDSYTDWLRALLIFLSGICILMFGWRTWKIRKDASIGQKLVLGALMLCLITLAWDRLIFIDSNFPLTLSIIPFILALVMLIVYLMEPARSYQKRLGRDIFDTKDD